MEKSTFTPGAFSITQSTVTLPPSNQPSGANAGLPPNSPESESSYCNLKSEALQENFNLKTDYEADLALLLLQVNFANDPRIPSPAPQDLDSHRGTFLK